MKYETAKSFILVILIATSLLLSVAIWTYQPNYEQFQDVSYVHEVDVGGKDLSRNELIEPVTIVFDNGYSLFGFSNYEKRSKLFKDISSWVLYDFQVMEVDERPEGGQLVEMIFPTGIPGELLPSLFTFNDEIDPPSWSFERVLITFNENDKSLTISFLSVDRRMQAVATVERSEKFNVLQDYLLNHEDVIEYAKFNLSSEPIYVPKHNVNMLSSTLVASTIEPESFINVLFSNPSLVTPNIGEAYFTDGQRGMKILHDGKQLEFINPIQTTFEQMDIVDLLDRSIDSISDHKGWTNDYLLEEINKRTNSVKYRLYYEGFPVYNYQNLAIIEQKWRHNELYQYIRPLLYLNNVLDTEWVELPSGERIIRYLKNESNLSNETIKDIKIGYYLSYIDDVSHSFKLSPSWYVKVANNWIRIDIQERGE